MKNTVIFDMDGVLVDSEAIYFKNLMDFCDKIALEPFSRDIGDYVGASTEATWRQLVPNQEQRRKVYRAYVAYGKAHRIDYATILKPGAKELLQFLCGENMRVALASAGRPMDIEQMLDDCDLRNYFDVVISGESVEHNKPDPDIYLEAMKQLGVTAPNVLVIEDSEKGIRAAKAAETEVWAIKQPLLQIDQSGASRIVNNLQEVQENLRRMILI